MSHTNGGEPRVGSEPDTERGERCTLVAGPLGQVWHAGGRTDRLLGVAPHQLEGVHLRELLAPEGRHRLFDAMRGVIPAGEPHLIVCELVGERGTVPVAISLEAVAAEGQQVERWVLRCERLGDACGRALPKHRPSVMTMEIERAFRNQEFELDLQPIVAVSGGTPVGYEALARWEAPGRGRLTAGVFIDAVDEAGLLGRLTRTVLELGVHQLSTWTGEGIEQELTVNVTPADLLSAGFAADVGKLVAAAGVDPQRLVLEFTEDALDVDANALQRGLARLHDVGVRLAVDDFSTRRSSLPTLALPIDVVKFDRRVTVGAAGSERDMSVLASLTDLCHTFGFAVVGAGVEDASQLEALERAGGDLAQGYLLGRPAPAGSQLQLL